MRRLIAGWLIALGTPALSVALSTQSFVIDSHASFEKGKLNGTAVLGDGRVVRSMLSERTAIDGAAFAYASAIGPDGAIYVGTGSQGSIYRVDRAQSSVFASTQAPLVSALVWVGNTLYAGTIERGQVLAIDRQGNVKEFATLPGAHHVWALTYDVPRATLYAATGPEGKLFAIDKQGRAQLVHDDDAEHLLCLAIDTEGRRYVGTSDGARLVRITGRSAQVLYDAPGQELTALTLGAGFVAIASNEFDPPTPSNDAAPKGGAQRRRTGKGRVFAVSLAGDDAEELYRAENTHITALETDARQEVVYAGLGAEGRIVRIARGQLPAVWADADERQIVALHLTAPVPHFLSSDGVALYRVTQSGAPGAWTSAVLDAKTPARFGALNFRKNGAVTFATRSGNTETPDATWSAWSTESAQPFPIHSPAARFLQIRANVSDDAELYAIEAYYLAQNQAARVHNVRAKRERTNDKSESAPPNTLTIRWDVDNPDGDRLRYRVFFAREGSHVALPLLREDELLERPETTWDTQQVPDGHYRVRVTVSDELTTPEPFVLRSEAFSAPVLVDNHPPDIRSLRAVGGHIQGEVVDTLGPIAELALSINGGHFLPIAAHDGLLDNAHERFEIALATLPEATRIVTIRARDAAGNTATKALELAHEKSNKR